MKHLKTSALTLLLALIGIGHTYANTADNNHLEYAFGHAEAGVQMPVTAQIEQLSAREMQQTEGEFFPLLIPGLVGASIDAAIYAATAENFNWTGLAKAAAIGAITSYIPVVAVVKTGVRAVQAGNKVGKAVNKAYKNTNLRATPEDALEDLATGLVSEKVGFDVSSKGIPEKIYDAGVGKAVDYVVNSALGSGSTKSSGNAGAARPYSGSISWSYGSNARYSNGQLSNPFGNTKPRYITKVTTSHPNRPDLGSDFFKSSSSSNSGWGRSSGGGRISSGTSVGSRIPKRIKVPSDE